MLNDYDQSAINPANEGSVPRSNSGINGIAIRHAVGHKAGFGLRVEIQSAMQTSKKMHRNEDFWREVAKRLF